jgi:hypothetical protein
MEWGLHGWVHRTVGTCSEKSCVCPSSLALMHARCSRLCNASYAKRTGGARCCNAARRYGHLHPFAHRCSAPSLAPEAAARAAESHRWYNVEDLLLTPAAHEHHPGRKRHELSARSARCTHTPPSHRSGLWSLSGVAEERSRTQRLMLCLSRDAACYRPERDVGHHGHFFLVWRRTTSTTPLFVSDESSGAEFRAEGL